MRDVAGRFAGMRARITEERTAAGSTAHGGGGVFKSAAVAVLRAEMRLLSTGVLIWLAAEPQEAKPTWQQ